MRSDYNDEMSPEFLENTGEPPRPRIVLRRISDMEPEVLAEDAIQPRKVRWWQVVGALLLVGVLLLETLLPVIEGLLQIINFVPAGGGQAL